MCVRLHSSELREERGRWFPNLPSSLCVENGGLRWAEAEVPRYDCTWVYARGRGRCGCRYVTMNVLVFDAEMQRVEERVRQMATAGVDAVIVQDLGVVQLIRRVAPNLPVHGSTQVCPW